MVTNPPTVINNVAFVNNITFVNRVTLNSRFVIIFNELTEITTITISSKLLKEIENNRGDISRSRFINKLLEFALKNQEVIAIK